MDSPNGKIEIQLGFYALKYQLRARKPFKSTAYGTPPGSSVGPCRLSARFASRGSYLGHKSRNRYLMQSTTPSRRDFISSLVLAGGALLGGGAPAQAIPAPAYEVSSWAGPVAGFRLLDTSGKQWTTADFAGRAVLLNFWASWCEPCRAEMPSLQQLADKHGPAKLLVLAINFKELPARAIQFSKTSGVALPVLLDVDGKAAAGWGVRIFPTTLLIDSRGRPRQRVKGEVDWGGSDAEKLVRNLVL